MLLMELMAVCSDEDTKQINIFFWKINIYLYISKSVISAQVRNHGALSN